MSSGLLRYRSTPSSLLGEVCEDFLLVRAFSPDIETMFIRFLAPNLYNKTQDELSGGAATASSQSNPHFLTHNPPSPSAHEVKEQQSRLPHGWYSIISKQWQMPSHSSMESSFQAIMLKYSIARVASNSFAPNHLSTPEPLYQEPNGLIKII